MPNRAENALIQGLARLLHNHGDRVLDGSRVLTLETPCLQVITRLIEQLFPRMPGSGFQALPSHPSDSISVLQTQFLLDMFQKAPSLKLIHPSGSPSQFDVNIFPFKALKCLELRSLPPHCLRGLRSVYSRLEVLICFRCLTSLAEIISLCGGDLTSALVWLELRTLNFSYNRIGNLDSSLELLNSLKVLDLSHNLIADCESYLKVLEELRYLNLGYNLLIDVPELSTAAAETLQTLILRHNQLSTTSGIEQLSNLQHLDLSYNLLHDHRQLKGLTRLHNLRKLFLEGNPLYFHKDHLALTSQYLSPRALNKMFMEGYILVTAEIMKLEEEFANQQTPISTNDNSFNVELTDSCSAVEKKTPSLPRKKSKVKVRTASISEPSDSDYERRPRKSEPVLRYQKDIERTESFRERYGADWLQYRDHLERELSQDDPDGHIFLPAIQSPPDALSFLTSIKPHVKDKQKTPPSSPELPKSAPEVSQDPPSTEMATEKLQEEDDYDDCFSWGRPGSRTPEEEEIVDPLSPLVAVCPVKDGRRRDMHLSCIFVRLTRQFLFEIGLEHGEVFDKRDLSTLLNLKTSVTRWKWKEEEQEFPLLTLTFSTVIEDRKRLQYVVLDDSPEISAKTLCDVLQPIVEENLKERARIEAAKPRISYRCLKCIRTFGQEEFTNTNDTNTRTHGRKRGDSLYSTQEDDSQDVKTCPICTSTYIVIVTPCEVRPFGTRTSSDPTVKSPEVEDPKFSNSEEDTDSPGTGSSTTPARSGFENRVLGTLDRVRQALKRASFSSGTGGSKSSSPSPPSNSEAADSDQPPEQPWNMCPGSWGTIDFRFVDHRLRVYLDFNVILEHKEEYRCCIKVPVIRAGKALDFSGLVVISNQKMYFLEISGEIRGSPCDWVKPGDAHNLTSLTHLHIGLNKQTLRLGFDGPGAAYTLLIGNPAYATKFCEDILETLTELPPQYLKNLVQIPEEVITPQHPIWPLLCAKPGAEISSPPEYLYLAVSFLKVDVVNRARDDLPDCDVAFGATLAQRAAAAKRVSLLITHNHAYILEETHQWRHATPPEGSDGARSLHDSFRIKEKESMVAVCAVHLFPSEPRHFHIRIDNERTETAWLLWTEDTQMPNVVAEFIKAPWEALFKVSFDKAINDNLNCCTPIPKP